MRLCDALGPPGFCSCYCGFFYGLPYLIVGLAFHLYEVLTQKPAEQRHARALLRIGAILSIPFFGFWAVACICSLFGR